MVRQRSWKMPRLGSLGALHERWGEPPAELTQEVAHYLSRALLYEARLQKRNARAAQLRPGWILAARFLGSVQDALPCGPCHAPLEPVTMPEIISKFANLRMTLTLNQRVPAISPVGAWETHKAEDQRQLVPKAKFETAHEAIRDNGINFDGVTALTFRSETSCSNASICTPPTYNDDAWQPWYRGAAASPSPLPEEEVKTVRLIEETRNHLEGLLRNLAALVETEKSAIGLVVQSSPDQILALLARFQELRASICPDAAETAANILE